MPFVLLLAVALFFLVNPLITFPTGGNSDIVQTHTHTQIVKKMNRKR